MDEKNQPSSYLGLFRAGLSTPEHRQFITVARDSMVKDIVDHLQRSMSRKSKHHLMFIGPRGSGKTHLLSLIEDQIAKQPDLASHYVVARFPEESNRTVSFADFLLGLCEILRDQLPDEPIWGQLHQQLATTEDDSIIIDTLVPAIRKQNHAHKRTIVVMLENVHEMFERQMSTRIDVGALRKFFMDDNGCLLIATAPMHFDAITSVKEPFFDFFDVQVLDLLSKEDSINLIRLNLEWDKRTDLLDDFKNMRPKLMALHDMTDGNPRLTLMLYELISHDSVLQVRQQFLQLLDRVTPFYQDRLRDIAPLERAVLETIATMRDSTQPKTPANIAARMRMSQQQTSNLLKRMTESLYLKSVVNPDDKRSRLYAIREGFFDIWLAMNLSRKDRARLPILVECLAKFYPQLEERDRKRCEYREKWGDANAEAAMDLMSEIGPPEERVKSKLELARLHGKSGNQKLKSGYFRELQEMPLDRVGQWIVRSAETETKTNYLDEIQEMIEHWSIYRSGDLERFVERLKDLGNDLSLKTYSNVKLEFLREHLDLVTDAKERCRLRSKIGELLRQMANWSDAERETRLALNEAESIGDDRSIAFTLTCHALLLQDTNRMNEAEPLMRRALAIDERLFGTDRPEVAIDLINLATLLQDTNRMDEAEPLIRRALAIDEHSFGSDDPGVAVDLNNLAMLLYATNRLDEAEPLMRRALAIDEHSFGLDHPEVAVDLNNLATLLHASYRLEEAESLMRRALSLGESIFGPTHPNVASSLNDLAMLLRDTDRLEEAEPLIKRAVAIYEQSYGAEHPNVAVGLNNLALLLKDTKRVEEAEALMRRALAIKSKHLVSDHPSTIMTRKYHAEILEELKHNAKNPAKKTKKSN